MVNCNRIIAWVLVAAGVISAGCSPEQTSRWQNIMNTSKDRLISPTDVISKPDDPLITVIRNSVSDLDPSSSLYPNAVRPTPADYTVTDQDYIIGPTDILDISVLDLYAEGLESVLRREVTDSGYIDLPQLPDRIKASGLTSLQLSEQIKRAYAPSILRRPIVSVTIMARHNQTFSALGAVLRPGTYNILRRDMRLLDALALAGDIGERGIDYIYVIRQAPPFRVEATPETVPGSPAPASQPTGGVDGQLNRLDDLMDTPAAKPALLTYAELGDAPAAAEPGGPAEQWQFRNGEWIKGAAPAPQTRPSAPRMAPATSAPATIQQSDVNQPRRKDGDPFGWAAMDKTDLVRVIAINLKQLRQGDYNQNIVIRENDTVMVPPLEIGEFYMMGYVNRPGVYSLTGRKITIKQALTAAGGFNPLGEPENSILVRRIGPNQETFIPINLEEIVQGKAPDYFLKADDVVMVGTHWSAIFVAVMRNAFRMTYGFGFIYDRNFSDPLLVTPNSNRFTRL